MAETEEEKARLLDLMRRWAELAEVSLSNEEMEKLLSNYEQSQNAIKGLLELDLTAYEPAVVLPRERIG